MNLRSRYNKVVQEYIDLFCKKQGVEFESWVGDRVGELGVFSGGIDIDFINVVYDVSNGLPKGLILEWYFARVSGDEASNYYSYSKGARMKKKYVINST